MKKSVVFIVLFIVGIMTVDGKSSLRPRGDVNCDWEVGLADVNALIDSIRTGAKYHSLYSYAADINGDKEINVADLNMLIDGIMGNQLPPMPTYSGTMPVLYINTDGYSNIDSKEEYVHATWWLDNMGHDEYQSVGSPSEPRGLQIKGRGNYTWTLDKKSFRIKLDTKEKLLGMKSNRHFCLLAHADDHYAKVKNALGFELSRRIGLSYTPADRPVEVVLNGQYVGLYFLTEKIREGKNRVNIEQQNDEETNLTDITGGWILEIDNNRDTNSVYFQERQDGNWYDWFWITSHYPEKLSPQQSSYIQLLFTRANAAIYTADKSSREWERYIDIDSLVSFYMIGEIMDDVEYFDGSCYMHKHKGLSTKLIFGPVWDFGNSFSRRGYYPGLDNYNYFLYQQPCFFYNHWIEEIAKFPHFQEVVRQRWHEFYGSGFNGLDIDEYIDNHVARIRRAWYSDAARWSGHSIEGEADKYKRYIHSKIDWLNTQWGEP